MKREPEVTLLPLLLAGLVLLGLTGIASASELASPSALPSYPQSEEVIRSGPEVVDYLLGLGAFQKIGGRWRHKDSELLRGQLTRITWQVDEGYTAQEAFQWLSEQIPESASLLFSCDGRSCGSSAQWANRVFKQRLLYGHDERQRYGVWRLPAEAGGATLVLYGVDRANRRHYVHLDLIEPL
jgi:hypothetical protein